jgi:hypothetical protein
MKGILIKAAKNLYDLLLGKDPEEEKTVQEKIQSAVQRELELANLKETTATTAISAALTYRKELAKLVAQSQELQVQALKAQKAGEEDKAKRILALRMAIDEKIAAQTDQYQKSDAVANNAIVAAKKQFKKAQDASQDLPRKIMQLEVNSMMDKAIAFEKDTGWKMSAQESYKALADSIDLKTAQLTARALIEDSSQLGLDEEVGNVIKEGRFEEEYKKLQQDSAIVRDADYTVVDNVATTAAKLLAEPAFGGTVPGLEATIPKKLT